MGLKKHKREIPIQISFNIQRFNNLPRPKIVFEYNCLFVLFIFFYTYRHISSDYFPTRRQQSITVSRITEYPEPVMDEKTAIFFSSSYEKPTLLGIMEVQLLWVHLKPLGTILPWWVSKRRPRDGGRSQPAHTEKFFRCLIESTWNQSENGKYNLISGWFNKISRKKNCV